MKSLIKNIAKSLIPNKLVSYNLPTQQVYLTFDDGPEPTVTPKLLDLLDLYKVKTTFFIVGKTAKSHPKILQDIHQRGHVLANHSYYHVKFNNISLKEQLSEITKTNLIIKQVTGKKTKFFRPPQGIWTLKLLFKLFTLKMTLAHWSRDSLDCRNLTPQEIIANFKQHPVKNGDIILFHDDDEKVIAILQELLPYWLKSNIKFSPLT
ncbi:MAG: polysaccharide deacetylase family protein [Colwellia sp.]|nr:polysaccharide deacetylase family protein [Colwellia sp.]